MRIIYLGSVTWSKNNGWIFFRGNNVSCFPQQPQSGPATSRVTPRRNAEHSSTDRSHTIVNLLSLSNALTIAIAQHNLSNLYFYIYPKHTSNNMPKANEGKKLVKSTKLTAGEKKKQKNDNKAKANPGKAAAKKEKNDNKRERRAESGSVKAFN
jgi:hypothetical protein